MSGEVSSCCDGQTYGQQNRSKRVWAPVGILRSLADKYPWEIYEPPYLLNNGLNNTTGVF